MYSAQTNGSHTGKIGVTTPYCILEDLFDSSTVAACEECFDMVETRRDVWVASPFDRPVCANRLLRLCNAVKRRLSRSQNTVLCGRILMFLASVTPISDKSGQ